VFVGNTGGNGNFTYNLESLSVNTLFCFFIWEWFYEPQAFTSQRQMVKSVKNADHSTTCLHFIDQYILSSWEVFPLLHERWTGGSRIIHIVKFEFSIFVSFTETPGTWLLSIGYNHPVKIPWVIERHGKLFRANHLQLHILVEISFNGIHAKLNTGLKCNSIASLGLDTGFV